MIWHLIAAVVAALGGAGIALILRSLTRKLLPKWIVPVFAGLGMLAYTIHYEYTWFDYKEDRLPEGAKVVSSENGTMMWRPWTAMFPMPVAYTVLDAKNAQIEESSKGLIARFVLYRFEKRHLLSTVNSNAYQLLCSEKVMFRLNEQGQAKFESMTKLAEDAPLYQTLCLDNGA